MDKDDSNAEFYHSSKLLRENSIKVDGQLSPLSQIRKRLETPFGIDELWKSTSDRVPKKKEQKKPHGMEPMNRFLNANLTHYWIIILSFAGLYLVLARTSLILAYGITNASPVWPPSGIALAVIIMVGLKGWPGILFGATAANIWVFWENVGNFKPWHEIFLVSLCIGIGNTGEALLANFILKLLNWGGYPMRTVDGTLKFLLTCPMACCISSIVGAIALCVWSIAPWMTFWTVWYTWWLGDLSGMLSLTPAILAWCYVPEHPRKSATFFEYVEVIFLFSALSGVCVLIFGGTVDTKYVVSLPYSVMPFIIWAAFRFNQRGTCIAVLVVTGAATWGSCRYSGSFHRAMLNESLLQVQLFNGVVAIMAIVLAAAVRERIDTLEALNVLNMTLEQRVEERTNDLRSLNRALIKSKEAAWAASQAKSQFLASMSHEIRTPIHGILGMTELTLMDAQLNQGQREQLQTVAQSANHLLMIVNDILDISKIEAGKLELSNEPMKVRQVVQACMQMLSVKASEKELQWSWKVHDDVPELLIGDAARLKQCLVNLVGNAVKFTSEGFVEVAVTLETMAGIREKMPPSWKPPMTPLDHEAQNIGLDLGNGVTRKRGDREVDHLEPGEVLVLFSVKDSGIGIPDDKREVIFHSFEQGDASMTKLYGGTGLGLSITSRLVQMMKGGIWVHSRVGQGSTFSFFVRLKKLGKQVDGNEAGGIGQAKGNLGAQAMLEQIKIGGDKPGKENVENNGKGSLQRWSSAPPGLLAAGKKSWDGMKLGEIDVQRVADELEVNVIREETSGESGKEEAPALDPTPTSGGFLYERRNSEPTVDLPNVQRRNSGVKILENLQGQSKAESIVGKRVERAEEEENLELDDSDGIHWKGAGRRGKRGRGARGLLSQVSLPVRSPKSGEKFGFHEEEMSDLNTVNESQPLSGESLLVSEMPGIVQENRGAQLQNVPSEQEIPRELSEVKAKDETLKILLADDSMVNRMVASRFLQKMGLKVVCVEDGQQALNKLAEEEFDLLLLDIQMPVLDGLDTARAIRQKEGILGCSRLPIVGLTAHASDVFRDKCLEAGMDDFVSKPFSMEKLSASMQAVLVAQGKTLPARLLKK